MPALLPVCLSLNWRASALAAVLALAGCATPPVGTAAGTSGPAAASASVAVAQPARAPATASAPSSMASAPLAPGQPPPFAQVIKSARKIDGLFTTWQKDEKVWLELRPEDFNQPFFFSPKLSSGIGESPFFGGAMLPSPRLVMFRRLHNMVQLLAINGQQVARGGTPEARAVAAAISPSLLASNPVASQPQPERKTVLVDASAMFGADLLGLGAALQRSYRQAYSLDARNSAITAVRGKPDLLVLEVIKHFATASIATAQPGALPGAPVPTLPSGLPDPRSLFLGLHYSLARLPAQVMAARQADARIGHFVSVVDDFSDDLARSPRQRFVNRWRLEKKDRPQAALPPPPKGVEQSGQATFAQDPSAGLSEPVKPITYWLDRNIPLKYRATLTAGVLEWNKAFEAIGFKNAIGVRQQADDADFDTLDAGVASLRWMVNREPAFGAIGPSHVDPRSGEILDADIGIESLSSRNRRSLRAQVLGGSTATDWAGLLQVGGGMGGAAAEATTTWPGSTAQEGLPCQAADLAADQLAYGLDLLAARGEIEPDSPEAQRFVLDYLKNVAMHEVGHTLGLRHNFRASHAFSEQQVSDPEFTRSQAFTGSVMEYAAINLARPTEPAVTPFQTTLGPYDYWAIEYAYRPLPAGQEAEALSRIAGRSGEPALAFGTDEDNFLGIDPDALQMDLGDDVLAFAARRFDIAQDLFQRQESRSLKPGEDYAGLRRALGYAVMDAGRAAGILLRQIGGVRTLRDFPNTGRDPLQPLPAARQRAALQMLSQRVLAAGSLTASPALLRKLAPDYFERSESQGSTPTDYPLAQSVLDLQRALLNRLMSDSLAARLLDNAGKLSPPEQPLRLGELYTRLEADVWGELAGRGDITPPRRELQREHVNRLAALVLRPGALSRSDARSLVRSRAATLAKRIEQASSRTDLGAEAQAHLQDCAESLRSALAAPLARAGV